MDAEARRRSSSRIASIIENTSSRICRLKSPWFTWPHIIVKSCQLAFGVAIMISFLLWESKGIRLFDLHLMDESINYRDVFVFYLGVAGITILYSVVLSIVGFSGVGAPVPVLEALLSVVCLLLWLFGSAFVSAVIENIENSYFARYRDLDTLVLRLGNGCGFVQIFVFTIEVFLSFTALKTPLEDEHGSKILPRIDSTIDSTTDSAIKSAAYLQGRAHRRKSLKKKL